VGGGRGWDAHWELWRTAGGLIVAGVQGSSWGRPGWRGRGGREEMSEQKVQIMWVIC
jgi:hypothetical protein